MGYNPSQPKLVDKEDEKGQNHRRQWERLANRWSLPSTLVNTESLKCDDAKRQDLELLWIVISGSGQLLQQQLLESGLPGSQYSAALVQVDDWS